LLPHGVSIADRPVIQKALRKIRRHGAAATLHFAWMKLVNRIVPFRILRGMHACLVDNAFLACPKGYSAGFVSAKTLAELAKDPAAELSAQFLQDAIGAGDECLAIFRGGELAAYGWYSTRPTPGVAPELVLHFAPGYVYQYKGFTVPAHRGHRLHAIGKTRALRHYLAKRYRGLLSYVESTNFESLKSNRRMGYETFGSIYVVRLFGRYFTFSTPGCRRFAFRIEPAAAPARPLRRGKV
jgi:hypothetical protein